MAHHRLVRQVSEHDDKFSAVAGCDINVVKDIIALNVRMIMFILLVGVIKVPLDDVLMDSVFFFYL